MLIRLSTPSGLAVPLDDVKLALRVVVKDEDGTVPESDDDDVLTRLIRQETMRYEDFVGRIMLPTEMEWRTDSWREPVTIPAFPIRDVTGIVYFDSDHVEQTLDPSEWYYVETDVGAEIRFTDTFSSPSLSSRAYPVRVRFEAGYDVPGTSGSGIEADPQDQGVITAMVGWLYDRDEGISEDLLRRMAGNRRIFR